jgi:NAD+ diphosphatase
MVAGYVEPGESLEHAVVRETREEVGLEVTTVTYRGSQPWPFPRSLMFAFEATVAGTPAPLADGVEITDARFFTRAELAVAVASGEVTLPGAASVAHGLLEHWYGGPAPA